MILGAIADDLTGATDLALTLTREGMRTLQVVGLPEADFDVGNADAVVIALKSRNLPARVAVAQSTAAVKRLLAAGAEQIVFKYCSTFDSTSEGNIGPVTEALLAALDEEITIVCPAFPTNGRTVYQGHLFVGNTLLSESPMKDHPLTPMRDSNLVRLIGAQTNLPIGRIGTDVIRAGDAAIREHLSMARSKGFRIVVVDAIDDTDLRAIGSAVTNLKLVTGSSGVALGLPENFRKRELLACPQDETAFAAPDGRKVILAGSCSNATRGQIKAAIEAGLPSLRIDPLEIVAGRQTPEAVADWAISTNPEVPLIYSSADPASVSGAQNELGQAHAGELVESFLGTVAQRLRANGFSRFLVAGGETSGAVVAALEIRAVLVGPEIDPGVPWTLSHGCRAPVALALKSGNFGQPDMFLKAWRFLR